MDNQNENIPVQTTPVEVVPAKKWYLHKGLIAIVVLVIFAGVAGYLVWLNHGAKVCLDAMYGGVYKNSTTGEVKSFDGCNDVPVGWGPVVKDNNTHQQEVADEFKGWSSYTNDALGIKLKYLRQPGMSNIGSNSAVSISLSVPKSTTTFDTLTLFSLEDPAGAKAVAQKAWAANKNDKNPNISNKQVSDFKEFSISNSSAYTFNVSGSFEDGHGGSFLIEQLFTYIYFENNGRVIEVNYPTSSELLKKTASTIAIIPKPNSSWKNYSNQNLGYEIKYPNVYQLSEQNNKVVLDSSYGKIEIIDFDMENTDVSDEFTAGGIQGYLQPTQENKGLKISFPNQLAKNKFVTFIFTNKNNDQTKLEEFRQIAETFNYILSNDKATWQKFSKDGISFSYPTNLFRYVDQASDSITTAQGFKGNLSIEIKNLVFDSHKIKGVYDTYDGAKLKQYKVGNKTGYELREGDAGCAWSGVEFGLKNQTAIIGFSECEPVNLEPENSNLYSDENLKAAILSTFEFAE